VVLFVGVLLLATRKGGKENKVAVAFCTLHQAKMDSQVWEKED
jgi:hypothetical protein